MAEQELLDVFDDNMTLIGKASRQDVHKKGLWHQSIHCWIVRQIGRQQYVLFQRRGPEKKVYPNTLDITAAGHLIAGETARDGVRELNEELGLSARFEELIPLGIRCDVAIIGDVTNREFCHVYLFDCGLELDAYRLQADEVSGLVQMEIRDCMQLFSMEKKLAHVDGYQVGADGAKRAISLDVSRDDVIPRLDGYYMKVCIMAERYFQGNRYLSV